MCSRAIPDPPWTVLETDVGAILDSKGKIVLCPLDIETTEEGLNLLKNVCFIRNAAPILARRVARASRIAQELTEALEEIKDASGDLNAYKIAIEALSNAATFGIKPRGRENACRST